ncbi:amidohydrolase family protein [Halochromatium sp.]
MIDTHLHYTAVDAAQLPPEQVIALFDRNLIEAAVVSGQPQWAIEALYRAAPDRILPFLSVYRGQTDKADWMHDPDLPARVAETLRSGIYRGLGELHLFAKDRESPVLAALVAIAAEQDLVLQIHGDAVVIEAIFAQAPELTVLWAHLGTDPRPQVVAPLLARYPRLFVDTSVRDERFVDNEGRLWPQWRRFFIAHQEQVLVGIDTYWTPRWQRFSEVAARIRGWLDQLPPEVAARLAYGNAARLFGLGARVSP